jgi:hypothetical protein
MGRMDLEGGDGGRSLPPPPPLLILVARSRTWPSRQLANNEPKHIVARMRVKMS